MRLTKKTRNSNTRIRASETYTRSGRALFGLVSVFCLAALASPAGFAFAVTEVANGCRENQMALTLMRPLPGQTMQKGQVVSFAGRLWQSGGTAQLGQCRRITFYVASDTDIPVSDCCGRAANACCAAGSNGACAPSPACGQNALCRAMTANAYGGTRSRGCAAGTAALFASEVKYLDAAGRALIKLGEIYPAATASYGNGGAKIFFDTAFTIPSDIKLLGAVRFYIQYSGIGVDNNGKPAWQWYVAYQKGSISAGDDASAGTFDDIATTPAIAPDYCSARAGAAAILNWSLDGGVKQAAYRVQIDDSPFFNPPAVDSGRVGSAVGSFGTVAGDLAYGTLYRWRVKVWTADDRESAWVSGPAFVTPKHAYPIPAFSWVPKAPTYKDRVTFSDESQVFGSGGPTTRLWTIEDGTPATSRDSAVKVLFAERGVKKIRLQVTDADGYTCRYERLIQVSGSLPDFED